MEEINELSVEDEMFHHLNEVYGNAQCALRCGATKENLLSQIEEALEVHKECLMEDGWLISAPLRTRVLDRVDLDIL